MSVSAPAGTAAPRSAPAGTAAPRSAPASFTLANGLRVVLLPDRRLPLVALHMSYDAGSRYEPTGRSGLAHLTEHLLHARPGRASGPGFPRGGATRAVTSFDRTWYATLVPAAQLAAGLQWEAERLVAARTNPAARWQELLEVERRVLLVERRERLASHPHDLAFERLHRLLFPPGHPYRRPPAGLSSGLRAATADDVRRFCRARYGAGAAVLALAGDLPTGTERLVEDYFGSLPGGGTPAPRIESAPAAVERRATARDHLQVGRAYVAYRTGGAGTPAARAASLLATALAVGRSSPLQQALVERAGLARRVRASLITLRDAGTLVFAATAERGVSAERLADALAGTLSRLLRTDLDPAAMARARKKVLIAHFTTVQSLAERTRLAADLGRPLVEDDPCGLQGLDAADLAGHAERWSQPGNRAVLAVLPQEATA